MNAQVVQRSLDRKREWLHVEDCPCSWGWTSGGRLYGVSMGPDWHRLRTERGCRHHDLCSKRITGPVDPNRPAWKLSPWCHRVRSHAGACSEGYDTAHGKDS